MFGAVCLLFVIRENVGLDFMLFLYNPFFLPFTITIFHSLHMYIYPPLHMAHVAQG